MKNIIVTGASSGIGFETAKSLAEKGNRVFAIARSKHKLESLQNSTKHGEIIPVTLDLSVDESIKHLTDVLMEVNQIHAIVNNAGVLMKKPFFETSLEDWDFQFQVNVYGIIRVLHAAKEKLTKGCHIVNIGSIGGVQGAKKFPGISAYSVSKGAVAILSECLSEELASEKVSVNCLALGAVQTDMLETAFPGYRAPVDATSMGEFITDFTLNAGSLINGKVIPVSLNNPG